MAAFLASLARDDLVPVTLRGYPRYFGYYDHALQLYTHTSDQHSVYATQAISCAPREASYVLSGILDNDTALDIREHTSDTHGFTEHLFGLCPLLGIAFMPRLKDCPTKCSAASNEPPTTAPCSRCCAAASTRA